MTVELSALIAILQGRRATALHLSAEVLTPTVLFNLFEGVQNSLRYNKFRAFAVCNHLRNRLRNDFVPSEA